MAGGSRSLKAKRDEAPASSQDELQEEEEEGVTAKPVGDPIKFTTKKAFFNQCEVDGKVFSVGDFVVLATEAPLLPYIGEIMTIYQMVEGNPDDSEDENELKVRMRWFYRPEEAEKPDGRSKWKPRHKSELYFSDHGDDNVAVTIASKVTIFFIPPSDPIPTDLPGDAFIVRYLYDYGPSSTRELYPITDQDFASAKLVKDLQAHIGATRARLNRSRVEGSPAASEPAKSAVTDSENAGATGPTNDVPVLKSPLRKAASGLRQVSDLPPRSPSSRIASRTAQQLPSKSAPEPASKSSALPPATSAPEPPTQPAPEPPAVPTAEPPAKSSEPSAKAPEPSAAKAPEPFARPAVQHVVGSSRASLVGKECVAVPERRPAKLQKVGAVRGVGRPCVGPGSVRHVAYGVKDPKGRDVPKQKSVTAKGRPLSEEGKALEALGLLTGIFNRDTVREKLLTVVRDRSLRPSSTATGSKSTPEAGTSGGVEGPIEWPESYVRLIVALEEAIHKASKETVYKTKALSMCFNLRKFNFTLERFLKGEIDPSVLVDMNPDELKHGKTKSEMPAPRSEVTAEMMQEKTDVHCPECDKRKVVIEERTAKPGTTYEILLLLLCRQCGFSWRKTSNDFHLLGNSIVPEFPTSPPPPEPEPVEPDPNDEDKQPTEPPPLADDLPMESHTAMDIDAPVHPVTQASGEADAVPAGADDTTLPEAEPSKQPDQGSAPGGSGGTDVADCQTAEEAIQHPPGGFISPRYPGCVFFVGPINVPLDRPIYRFTLPGQGSEAWPQGQIVALSDEEAE